MMNMSYILISVVLSTFRLICYLLCVTQVYFTQVQPLNKIKGMLLWR